jgi:hypothetical protein
MSRWLPPYPYQSFSAIGEGTFTSQIPGFPATPIQPATIGWDYGSYSQVIDAGAATGENVNPQANAARDDSSDQQQQESAFIATNGAVPPPAN